MRIKNIIYNKIGRTNQMFKVYEIFTQEIMFLICITDFL